MSTLTPTQDKHRGVIILNRKALKVLSAPPESNETVLSSRVVIKDSYLDLLPELARNGYRILIPEAACVLVGGMFADGTDRTLAESSKSGVRIKRFLAKVLRNECENISIVTPSQKYQQEIQSVKDRVADNDKMPKLYRDEVEEMDRTHMFDAMAGEIKRQTEAKEETPIFMLTASQEYREELFQKIQQEHSHQDPHVNALTLYGMFTALNGEKPFHEPPESSALSLLGLKGGFKRHWDHLCVERSNYISHNPSFERGPQDTGVLKTYPSPFAASLKGLAQEIVDEREQNTVVSGDLEKNHSLTRLERFKLQQAKTAKLQGRG